MTRIIEVGPRDGLQNQKDIIPTDRKVAFVDVLSQSGVSEIEVSAFVSPKWIPQLADASEVFSRIARNPGITYSALVPNEQGFERAIAAHVDKIAVFTAASETFNQKNINSSIAESIERFKTVVKRARAEALPVRGYISTAFWCPYEGRIEPEQVLEVADKLIQLGVDELSIGDTIGKANADEVERLLNLMLKNISPSQVAMHFHDTYGQAADNVERSWQLGVTAFDSSAGGLGGCPYAPGAPGNVATEVVAERLAALGARINVSRDMLRAAIEALNRRP